VTKRTSSTRLTACPTPNFVGFIDAVPNFHSASAARDRRRPLANALYHLVGRAPERLDEIERRQGVWGDRAWADLPRGRRLVNDSLIAGADNG
jgi:hypothetical protein